MPRRLVVASIRNQDLHRFAGRVETCYHDEECPAEAGCMAATPVEECSMEDCPPGATGGGCYDVVVAAAVVAEEVAAGDWEDRMVEAVKWKSLESAAEEVHEAVDRYRLDRVPLRREGDGSLILNLWRMDEEATVERIEFFCFFVFLFFCFLVLDKRV